MNGSEFVTEMETALRARRMASGENGKTILVTGGAGFLGASLCEVLAGQGHHVICLDNLTSGRIENVAHLLSNPKFRFLNHDIVSPLTLEGDLDEIYNLACPASPEFYQRDPVQTFKSCVLGALNMLELARDKGARILQASTSEVYGDPEVSPQTEEYRGSVTTVGPRSCYDEGKRAAETLFHDFNQQYGVVTKIARIFNTYGPRMRVDDGRVVSNFIVQALTGQDLTVYGKGTQTRSFCYLDDMIDGLVRLMNSPEMLRNPVNLGNPDEFSVLGLAEIVLGITGARSGITFKALPRDDPRQRRPDITAAGDLLGWTPRIPLREGLALTVEHFQTVLGQDATSTATRK